MRSDRPLRLGPSPAATRPIVATAWLALALALAVLHLTVPIAALPRLVTRNYNEGWNAYHAEAVFSERSLYPEASALFPNNYPPLSFAVVALAARGVGDPIRAGRLLSLAAFLLLLVEIGAIAARSTGSRRLGVLAGLLAASWMGAGFSDYVGMDDPQLMAHAAMLGGLLLLLGGLDPARLGGAALLMVLGGLVKHNLIALPLAVGVWLFGRDRHAFRLWAASAAAAGVAALGALSAIHGEAVFASVLRARTASLALGARVSADWLRILAAPLAVGALATREAWRDPDDRLLVLYAGFALGLGFFFASGTGVSVNAYFDLLIALALLGPLLIARLRALLPEASRVIPVGALVLALLVDPLLQAPDALLGLPERLAELDRWETGTREDIAYLAAKPGPVICETLALCFWAGKPAGVDLFNAQQLFRGGVVDEEALLGRIERGEFTVVQLTSLSRDRDDDRVSLQLTNALQHAYVVDRVGANGVFLRPRRLPPSR